RRKIETAEEHEQCLAKVYESVQKRRRWVLEPTEQKNNNINKMQ
ncbi:20272_t:CDS:2, partial [Racocetra persica]